MGNCCAENKTKIDDTVLILDEGLILKEKIYKVFRLNPFHNYGSRRQVNLEREFIDCQEKHKLKSFTVIDFFSLSGPNSKIFSKIEKSLISYTRKILHITLREFENPEKLFLNVLMFILSNTKNNLDKKQEIITDVINYSFFESKDEKKIDLEKFKKYVKSLIIISLTFFLKIIMLQFYLSEEKIKRLLDHTHTSSKTIENENKIEEDYFLNPDYIINKISSELKKNYTYTKLLKLWEEHLLSPIIFASYSHEKNIANYNLTLKNEIMNRIINIFNTEKIIHSLIYNKIE